jgi:hypothetical protein
MEAIRTLNEPGGSQKTAIGDYIEVMLIFLELKELCFLFAISISHVFCSI